MYGYIYLIVNKVNGKTYIGQHKSSKEWFEDNYMGSGSLLYKAKNKYGIENFEKFLIQYVSSFEDANEKEIFWISYYKSLGKAGYNVAKGGNDHCWNRGCKMSEEFCKKNSEGHKGQIAWNKNKKFGPHHTKPHTDETKSKISKSMIGNHNNPKGYHWKLVNGKRIRFE